MKEINALSDVPIENQDDNIIQFIMAPMYFKLFELQCEKVLTTGMLILGIEIERYKISEGRLPATIDDLVPEHIDAVPVSSFDGEPLHYELIENGYWVGYHGTTMFDTHIYDVEGNGTENTGQPYVRKFLMPDE